MSNDDRKATINASCDLWIIRNEKTRLYFNKRIKSCQSSKDAFKKRKE